MTNIAILGSGNGSNAQRICEYFHGHADIAAKCIIYNRKDAFIAQRATNMGIPSYYFTKQDFSHPSEILELLRQQDIDYIILAGFLLLLPIEILEAYPDRILNIHPSLLPKHGGAGMFGDKVHQAAIDCGDTESGITIHLVDQHYDQGKIIFQAQCPILEGDTAATLAQRVHQLEYQHYPQTIERFILNQQ